MSNKKEDRFRKAKYAGKIAGRGLIPGFISAESRGPIIKDTLGRIKNKASLLSYIIRHFNNERKKNKKSKKVSVIPEDKSSYDYYRWWLVNYDIDYPIKLNTCYENAKNQGFDKIDYTGILQYIKKINES